jgi:transposase
MTDLYYVGLDVHKKTVSCCVKAPDGRILKEQVVKATPRALEEWARGLDRPWIGAMEATLFTGWIYDQLNPHARALKVGHPAMMRAIAASKKKNDRLDACKIADLVRCDLVPECYVAPREIRDLRRALRFRNFLVRLSVMLKNKTAGLLMECGVEYSKNRLHGKRYFADLLGRLDAVPDSVREMLRFDHGIVNLLEHTQGRIVRRLTESPLLVERVTRLQSIQGVGPVASLTWALEVGDPHRFPSIRRAVSYCGLSSAQRSSAGKESRGPISKQRNAHLQWVLIETAKLAPRWNPRLAEVRSRALERGNRNRATLAVARKLVAYLLAVDKRERPFEAPDVPAPPEAVEAP